MTGELGWEDTGDPLMGVISVFQTDEDAVGEVPKGNYFGAVQTRLSQTERSGAFVQFREAGIGSVILGILIWISIHPLLTLVLIVAAIAILFMFNQMLRTLMGYTTTRTEGYDTDGDGIDDLILVYDDRGGLWQCSPGADPENPELSGCIMLSAPGGAAIAAMVPLIILGVVLVGGYITYRGAKSYYAEKRARREKERKRRKS